jgi:hypothetical protein
MLRGLQELHNMINKAKTTFLEYQILDSSRKRVSLFRLIDSLLLPKPVLRLPVHSSLTELFERFSDFFVSKIVKIREDLDAAVGLWVPEVRVPFVAFVSFAPVSAHDMVSLIMNCPTKSSPLDPLPTFVLKECLSTLAPWIADFVNLSLNTATFPHEMKLAHVIPLLKKNGPDPDVLSNYRPVSLLSFLSKLLERVVAMQLVNHLESQSFFAAVWSPYRPCHSTETALLKVVNDETCITGHNSTCS